MLKVLRQLVGEAQKRCQKPYELFLTARQRSVMKVLRGRHAFSVITDEIGYEEQLLRSETRHGAIEEDIQAVLMVSAGIDKVPNIM